MKLLIAGYYGFGNEGDELLLASLLHALAGQGHAITVLSRAPEATTARHGVRATDRWNPGSWLREIHAADALVFGGGGLIQDLSGPFTPAYYLGLLATARFFKKRTILLGQGVGPLSRALNRSLACRVLRQVDGVVARDPESYSAFLALGVPAGRAVQGADLAWLLPWPEMKRRPARPEWGVCLRADWLAHQPPAWLPSLRTLAESQGRGLRFIALGDRGDQMLLDRLRRDPSYAGYGFAGADVAEAGERFARLEWVISMRYHGLVLAAQSGAFVLGWGRDRKLGSLLAEMKQPLLNEASPDFAKVWERRDVWREHMKQSLPNLRQRARLGLAEGLRLLMDLPRAQD